MKETWERVYFGLRAEPSWWENMVAGGEVGADACIQEERVMDADEFWSMKLGLPFRLGVPTSLSLKSRNFLTDLPSDLSPK